MSKGIEKFELNYEGVGKLLKSDMVMKACLSASSRYNAKHTRKFVGFDRCHVFVSEGKDKT